MFKYVMAKSNVEVWMDCSEVMAVFSGISFMNEMSGVHLKFVHWLVSMLLTLV